MFPESRRQLQRERAGAEGEPEGASESTAGALRERIKRTDGAERQKLVTKESRADLSLNQTT